jgi:hypothetical protein
MNKDLSDHLVNDKDNKFHGTSVAQRLRDFPGMPLSLYLEVQMVWERLLCSREENLRIKADYTFLLDDLRDIIRRHDDD